MTGPDTKAEQLPHRPLLYVCLLSQYTVANAQAVKWIRPDRVVAVSSPMIRNQGGEERFLRLVRKWGMQAEVLGSDDDAPFPAQRLDLCAEWMQSRLCPMLEQARQDGMLCFANLTGSTKAGALALHNCWEWDERHYTAEGARNQINVLGHPSGQPLFGIPSLELIEEARLLNDGVEPLKDPWARLDQVCLHQSARLLHEDYLLGPERSVMARHGQALALLWFGRGRQDEALAACGIVQQGRNALLSNGELRDFLMHLVALDPENVRLESDRLLVPAEGRRPWPRFVSGGWWEVLVADWLAEWGIPTLQNVRIIRPDVKTTDTEADFLVRCQNGEMRAVECKVDLFMPAGSVDMVKVLNDLSRQYGKSEAGLALSPAFWWKFTDEQQDNFTEACRLRRISILDTRDKLRDWVCNGSREPALQPYVHGQNMHA